jgi:hypothetical protein
MKSACSCGPCLSESVGLDPEKFGPNKIWTPPNSRADPIGISATLKSTSEMKLRFRSQNLATKESQIAIPGVRMMIPSRTKRRIAARSTIGRESPETCGAEKGGSGCCCRRGEAAAMTGRAGATVGAVGAVEDGGARLLGGDVISRQSNFHFLPASNQIRQMLRMR